MIMNKLPDTSSSTTIAGAAAGLIFAGLQIFGRTLVAGEEPKLILFAGFLCSLIFFFTTIALGNLKRSEEVGWLEIFVALAFALGTAASVHRICVTTAFLFSVGLFFYLSHYSSSIRSRVESVKSRK